MCLISKLSYEQVDIRVHRPSTLTNGFQMGSILLVTFNGIIEDHKEKGGYFFFFYSCSSRLEDTFYTIINHKHKFNVDLCIEHKKQRLLYPYTQGICRGAE